eukprot:8793351-Ditylum_brightwellii.AAC.1
MDLNYEEENEYVVLPSIETVAVIIDTTIVANKDPSVSNDTDGFMPCIEMHVFAAKLLDNALMDKINSAFGTIELNPTKDECPLFTTTLDGLRDMHAPEISEVADE